LVDITFAMQSNCWSNPWSIGHVNIKVFNLATFRFGETKKSHITPNMKFTFGNGTCQECWKVKLGFAGWNLLQIDQFSLIWKSFKMAIRKGATCSQNKVISWALEPFEDLAHFRKPNHVWLKKLKWRVFQSTRKWSWTFVWLNDFFGVMRFLDKTLGILGIFPFQCSLHYL
jgi:hypothetical protein